MKTVASVIYRLCQSRGLPIYYFSVHSQSGADAVTGLKDLEYSIHPIAKALILNDREYRAFVYDLAFISANKDFTTGGYFDPSDRTVFCNWVLSHPPKVDDYLYVNGQTYVITEVSLLEENYYRLKCKNLRGAPNLHIVATHTPLLFVTAATSEVQDKLTQVASSVLSVTSNVKEAV